MMLRFSTFLELLGTILLASSLAGPERLSRWEKSIQKFFRVRKVVSLISDKIHDIRQKSFSVFLQIFLLIILLVFAIMLIFGDSGVTLYLTLTTEQEWFPVETLEILTEYWPFSMPLKRFLGFSTAVGFICNWSIIIVLGAIFFPYTLWYLQTPGQTH